MLTETHPFKLKILQLTLMKISLRVVKLIMTNLLKKWVLKMELQAQCHSSCVHCDSGYFLSSKQVDVEHLKAMSDIIFINSAGSYEYTREKLKNTYDRSRIARLMSMKSTHTDKFNNTTANLQIANSPAMSTTNNNKSLTAKSLGIYFRKEFIDFGRTCVGSMSRTKVEVCNSTDKTVYQ